MEERNAYQVVKEELDKTIVISPEFKNWILAWLSSGMEDAFRRGREEGLKGE